MPPSDHSSPDASAATNSSAGLEISPGEVQQWLEVQRQFIWLDCREQPEFDWVHLPNSTLLPMSELVSRVEEL